MFISALNKELDTLDYSLRLSRNEQDGDMYLIMVNTNQDAVTELATTFTAVDMAFIRELVLNLYAYKYRTRLLTYFSLV